LLSAAAGKTKIKIEQIRRAAGAPRRSDKKLRLGLKNGG
jgi:hypothetical protein